MTRPCSRFGILVAAAGVALLSACMTRSHSTRAQQLAKEDDSEQLIQTMAHYATGLSYDLNDKSDLALEEMVRAAQSDPSYEPVVIEAARRCIRAQKPELAIDLLRKATAVPDASGSIYAWLGLAYAQVGKPDLAIASNKTAIQKLPLSLGAYQNLAQIYLQSSRTNEALQVLDSAAQQPTDDPGFLVDLADLYLRYGHVQTSQEEAIKVRVKGVLDRAVDLNPTNPIHILRLADTYFGLGELKKAEPLYRSLAEEHPDLPSLRSKLTEIYLRSGDKGKASEQLEALTRSEPTNPQAYVLLGAIAADEKKWKEASENFERALRLDPDLEQVYYDAAGLKLGPLKQPQEALALLEKARARFKRSFAMEFYTGVAYNAAKNYAEALKYLTSAEAIARATEPSRLNHLFYFQLGAVHERAGHLDEAEKYFRESLKLAPDDAEALNYLGYMWADRGIKLDEARTFIQKAVALQPDNAAFLDSLAWVLFKLKKPSEALAPLLKAIEHSDEPDATLYDHLGDIYSALQQLDRARDAWGKALKIEPNEEIQKKLQAAPTP